ncbi:uncharacterized protein N7500_005777 [Penicillium coprophilum]|uniref:uncharacterized protein n=1 Tax=Penicillium coprophilum TaxID=36646 RepID=UPI002382C574|nr:uncharacterized protein N7500_005777 [Penicillium coprophilum]KAJ5163947.1 hypothetical protein N7500_005777 [Penicillium coprophilum]
MSSKTTLVAVTQAEPEWLDLATSVAKTCKLIAEAAQNAAQLIAFPECWIPGYPCWIWGYPLDVELHEAYIKDLIALDFPEMNQIEACAKSHSIAV